eukprot:14218460-Alexandrium_andersonii.AAC.1
MAARVHLRLRLLLDGGSTTGALPWFSPPSGQAAWLRGGRAWASRLDAGPLRWALPRPMGAP